jgi:hypothetical protein
LPIQPGSFAFPTGNRSSQAWILQIDSTHYDSTQGALTMQLKFLGRTYEINSGSAVEGVDTEETVKFLGRRYAVRRYDGAPKQSPSEDLKFLGRRYKG